MCKKCTYRKAPDIEGFLSFSNCGTRIRLRGFSTGGGGLGASDSKYRANRVLIALFTATSGINTVVEAGLPDVTGNMIYLAGLLSGYMACFAYPANEQGCFYSEQYSSTYALPNITLRTDLMCARTHFAASKSNAIYGNSTTVTPPSVKCNYLIRHD